jgi:hypothetical protein
VVHQQRRGAWEKHAGGRRRGLSDRPGRASWPPQPRQQPWLVHPLPPQAAAVFHFQVIVKSETSPPATIERARPATTWLGYGNAPGALWGEAGWNCWACTFCRSRGRHRRPSAEVALDHPLPTRRVRPVTTCPPPVASLWRVLPEPHSLGRTDEERDAATDEDEDGVAKSEATSLAEQGYTLHLDSSAPARPPFASQRWAGADAAGPTCAPPPTRSHRGLCHLNRTHQQAATPSRNKVEAIESEEAQKSRGIDARGATKRKENWAQKQDRCEADRGDEA